VGPCGSGRTLTFSLIDKWIIDVCVVSSDDGKNKVQSPVPQLVKQPMRSPTRTVEMDVPASRGSTSSKNQEEEDEEVIESDSETEESSSDEGATTTQFVEYDAEPLSKNRTQSRSTAHSMADNGDVQQQPPIKSPIRSPPQLELMLPVAATSEQIPVTSVSPGGRLSGSSVSSAEVSTESGFAGKFQRSPDRASRLVDLNLRSPAAAASERIPVLPTSPVGTVSQPSPVPVYTELAYVGKSQKSPVVRSPVPSFEPDYSGKFQRPPSVHSPVVYTEPGDALKFQRSPVPVANAEPVYSGRARKSPNYAGMSPQPQLEYAQFDSEPMSRNRRNIPYVDDDDELPTPPLPGSPLRLSNPPVKTPTLSAMPAPPVTPLITQSSLSFVQTYEMPLVMAPRAAAGPVLMPPPPMSEPIAASPVLHVNPNATGYTSQDSWRTSETPAGRVRPSSVSRMSPVPPTQQVETSADAVSQLFMNLETNYTNPSPASQMPVRSQVPSYGPGYRPPTHGAVVRAQEPYPIEVQQALLLTEFCHCMLIH